MAGEEDQIMKDELMEGDVPLQDRGTKNLKFDLGIPLHMWSLIPESKLILIIRIEGENNTMSSADRKLLNSMRLQKLNTAVFVKADESIMAILRRLKRFVTYRYPSLENVKGLVYHAAVKFGKQITLLRRNNVVEQAFGQYNINCIDDVVNEIVNVGSHFKDVSTTIRPLLFPYLKRRPSKGKKKCHSDGGDAGNREVIELISKMKMA